MELAQTQDDAETMNRGERRRRRWARAVFVGACSVVLGYVGVFECLRHDARSRPGSGLAGAVLITMGGPIAVFVLLLLGAVLIDLGRRGLAVWVAALVVVAGLWVLAHLGSG